MTMHRYIASMLLLVHCGYAASSFIEDSRWQHQCSQWHCFNMERCPSYCYVDVCLPGNSTCNSSRKICREKWGQWKCLCKHGYVGEDCHDVDECGSTNVVRMCHRNATCANSVGSFTCKCNEGFKGDEINCDQLCPLSVNATCDPSKEICQKVGGEWKCICRNGYTGRNCQRRVYSSCGGVHSPTSITSALSQIRYPYHDIHVTGKDCMWVISAGVPIVLQFTRFNFESDQTSCSGFVQINKHFIYCDKAPFWTSLDGNMILKFHQNTYPLKEASFTVNIDIDLCQTVENICHENATCIMTNETYNCTCKPGFQMVGDRCSDINECTLQTHNCHQNATCDNTIGSFTCRCDESFHGDGTKCVEVCPLSILATCDSRKQICVQGAGRRWKCVCRNNYTGNDCERMVYDSCHRPTRSTLTNGMVYAECHRPTRITLSNINIKCYSTSSLFSRVHCVWYLKADVPIYIQFINFDVGTNNRGCNDAFDGYIWIDGREKYCGTELPPSRRSTSGEFQLSFYSGVYIGRYGFEVVISTDVCQTMQCHPNAICSNLGGKGVCKCKFGYKGNGTHCSATKCSTCNEGMFTKEPTCSSFYLGMFHVHHQFVDNYEVCGWTCLSSRQCSQFLYLPAKSDCYLMRTTRGVRSCSDPDSVLGKPCHDDYDCSAKHLYFRVMEFDANLNGTSWKIASTKEVHRSMDDVKRILQKNIICYLSDGSISRIDDNYEIDKYFNVTWKYKLVFRTMGDTIALHSPPSQTRSKSFNMLACMLGLLAVFTVTLFTVWGAKRVLKQRRRRLQEEEISYNAEDETVSLGPGLVSAEDASSLQDVQFVGNTVHFLTGRNVLVPIGAPPVYSQCPNDDENVESGVTIGTDDLPLMYLYSSLPSYEEAVNN